MAMEKNLPICFLYLYCLGIDELYFVNLLGQFVGVNLNNTLLEFSNNTAETMVGNALCARTGYICA